MVRLTIRVLVDEKFTTMRESIVTFDDMSASIMFPEKRGGEYSIRPASRFLTCPLGLFSRFP
jgi:hypothetical protein